MTLLTLLLMIGSLLHYETHLRNAHTGGLNAAALRNTYYQDQEVIFLQVLLLLCL